MVVAGGDLGGGLAAGDAQQLAHGVVGGELLQLGAGSSPSRKMEHLLATWIVAVVRSWGWEAAILAAADRLRDTRGHHERPVGARIAACPC